jgi:DNA polymerase III subunit gamma/tau
VKRVFEKNQPRQRRTGIQLIDYSCYDILMHITLYRKHRPEKFEDVVGQDHIVTPLQNSLKNKTVSHAYLFHGTRGTGKTTIARIFARELGVTQNDLYEMDAASNRNIDDIRDLRESVKTIPFESEYKVYIMDEVHMLTKEAFNALLKTLEEPPSHVIFILATTEIHKIPETIISRCEVHTFKEPTNAILSDVVVNVAKKEGFSINKAVGDSIALLGERSFRDTLGVLQKVITSSSGKQITDEDVEKSVGVPRRAFIREFIEAFVTKDIPKALEVFHKVLNLQADPRIFLKLALHILRMSLLLKTSKNSKIFVEGQVSGEDFVFIQNLVEKYSKDINSKTLLALLKSYDILAISPIPEIAIELSILDLAE